MTDWGNKLIAAVATLALIAVLGALTVIVADWIDPTREGPTATGLALVWAVGITAMYSPLTYWIVLLVMLISLPWLVRQPKLTFALAGLLLALPLVLQGETIADKAIRLALGGVYGEVFRRLLIYRLGEKWNR